MDSKETDSHYDNPIAKIKDFFEPMTENQRPFQVAIGGGEPTSHPDFVKVLEVFKDLGIEPNYTTNGMWLDFDYSNTEFLKDGVTHFFTEKHLSILENTKKYCGGVAISCHPHLKDYWTYAAHAYNQYDIKLNFHIIISDKQSVDYFAEICYHMVIKEGHHQKK
jgi:organic radical activating enzyme